MGFPRYRLCVCVWGGEVYSQTLTHTYSTSVRSTHRMFWAETQPEITHRCHLVVRRSNCRWMVSGSYSQGCVVCVCVCYLSMRSACPQLR